MLTEVETLCLVERKEVNKEMAEEMTPGAGDITDNDKLLAAVSYPIPIVAIVILLAEEMKSRPFQKFHAVQALVVNVVLWAIVFFISIVTCGLGAILAVLWLVTLYWAYKAYQGEYFDIPVVTDFIIKQGWAEKA